MSLASILERSRRDREDWVYTNLTTLLKKLPENSTKLSLTLPLPATNVARYVFSDGVLQSDQSVHGDLPSTLLQGDPVAGYRMVLEGQTCLVTQPVELLFLSSGLKPETAVSLHVDLGANGRLTLIERHQASGSGTTIVDTKITLQPQAKLVHGKIVTAGSASHLATTYIDVAEGSYYDNFALIVGGHVTRNEIHMRLGGKMAQGRLNGAMLLAGTSHGDTTTHITHASPHGTSCQLYKTVLADKAHGVFQGKIVVAQDAQKTDGHQLSRALLLSDQAEMNAKPQLEIYADDVKCSHGSTVGELDAEALFYLRSRGLNETAARALLLEAFVARLLTTFQPVKAVTWFALT